MQKTLILLVSIIVISHSLSCKRIDDVGVDNEFEASGEILGIDLTLCACCGGHLLQIEGETETYNINDFPTPNDLDIDNAEFPLKVRFNWTANISEACPRIVRIESIEKE